MIISSNNRFRLALFLCARKLILPAMLEMCRMPITNCEPHCRMKNSSLFVILLPLLFLVACGSKPKNLIYSGMTTSRLVEKYGEPVRKESSEDGNETWYYKAQKIVKTTSQEDWSTDTASPNFSGGHGDVGSSSTGSSVSWSRTANAETVGIPVRNGEVVRSPPEDLQILGSP